MNNSEIAFWLATIIISTCVSSVTLQTNLVEYCKNQSTLLLENQAQYPTRNPFSTPQELPGPQFPELLMLADKKIRVQTPFECIYNRTNEESRARLRKDPKYQELVSECKAATPDPHCDKSYPYRTINGTCNNLKNPFWGSVLSCFARLLSPSYKGVAGFRESVCGGPLPNARNLSLELFHDKTEPSKFFTQFFPFFGQQIAHDITDEAVTFYGSQELECCPNPKVPISPQCAPIYISKNDPFYSEFNVTCLDFPRGAPCDTCSLEKRHQMNLVTSYIDCSFIYGSTYNKSQELRRLDGTGKLKSQKLNGSDESEELLLRNGLLVACSFQNENLEDYCFSAGDRRVNQHMALMVSQTAFMREHNRIAEGLKKVNPKWGEEKLYLVARFILGAGMQHITYNEFLSLLIGKSLMSKYDLWPRKQGRTKYNPQLNPTIFSEFATSAYRLHSLLHKFTTTSGVEANQRRLKNTYGDASPLYEGKISSLARGICGTPSKDFGKSEVEDMTEYLVRLQGVPFGFDSAAVDIQRGRDNGIPPYFEYLKYFSGRKSNITSFNELEDYIDSDKIRRLRKAYCDVRDIDLWTGLNYERVPDDAVVGPTTGNIIALMFNRLKFGDRYFYEHEGNFNDGQLETIKRASTLSNLLCKTLKINEIQQNAMLLPSSTNPMKPCSFFPLIDFTKWKE